MLRQTLSLSLLLLSLVFAPCLTALAAPLYQVEVIVFKYLTPPEGQEETWPRDPKLPTLSNAINLQAQTTAAATHQTTPEDMNAHPMPASNTNSDTSTVDLSKITYHYLPSSAFHLSPQETALIGSKQYQVLLHTAWLQTTSAAPTIHLFGGMVFDSQGNPIQMKVSRYQPNADSANTPGAQWELDGTLQVNKDQYYTAKTNLVLTTINPPAKSSWFESKQNRPIFTRYVMKDTQRMKENELHYFDHPRFGVLIGVYRKEE